MSIDSWWDHRYPIRLPVNLDSGIALIPEGHPVSVTLAKSKFMGMGKVRRDFLNIEVLEFAPNATPEWSILGREITETSDSFTIYFNCVDSFDGEEVDRYFVYYGRNTSQELSRPDFQSILWPNSVSHSGIGVSYTRPGEYWVAGESSTPNAVATFSFRGPRVGLFCDKGNYGILEVRTDDGDWQSVDLFAEAAASDQLVWTQSGLSNTDHSVQVRCTGRKSPQSSSFKVNISNFRFENFIDILDSDEEVDIDVNWTSIVMGGDNG